ncbi:MAG: phosphatase PAP2 family protein [Planctomycetes bacterium]|nr:phosphatase PAP2 family protein [Planctomycetota bacterium]
MNSEHRLSPGAEKALLAAGLWALFGLGYTGTNHWNVGRETARIGLPLDAAIQYSPWWEIVYSFVYFFVMLPVPLVAERKFFRRVCGAYVTAMLLSFACFVAFPVSYPRPDIVAETFFDWTVLLNYRLDPPNNCLPSLHIAIAYLAAFVSWRLSRPFGWVALAVATAIAVSTLFVKQHYVLDIAGGILVAALAHRLWFRNRLTVHGRRVMLAGDRR